MEDFSVIDNLKMVCDEIELIIKKIKLKNKIKTPTKLLSGGEKQRLAIGRALAKSGKIILLDEPIGNLDAENATIIFDLLKSISLIKTIVIASHDLRAAYLYADHIIFLNSGRVEKSIDLSKDIYELDFPKKKFAAF